MLLGRLNGRSPRAEKSPHPIQVIPGLRDSSISLIPNHLTWVKLIAFYLDFAQFSGSNLAFLSESGENRTELVVTYKPDGIINR